MSLTDTVDTVECHFWSPNDSMLYILCPSRASEELSWQAAQQFVSGLMAGECWSQDSNPHLLKPRTLALNWLCHLLGWQYNYQVILFPMYQKMCAEWKDTSLYKWLLCKMRCTILHVTDSVWVLKSFFFKPQQKYNMKDLNKSEKVVVESHSYSFLGTFFIWQKIQIISI
jgi:hypothetical protein